MSHRSIHRVAIATLLAACSASAFAQANSCAAATVITTGTFSGNTATATNDGTCSCSTAAGKDLWFKFRPTTAGPVEISLCDNQTWNSVLSVHAGCPGSASNTVACNDDSCGVRSSLTVNVSVGRDYLIRVSGATATDAGPFTLTVGGGQPPPGSAGPDVWVNQVTDIAYYTTTNGVSSYALGTDACNRGDVPVEWVRETNHHPVIAQNIYRLKGGRFEQLGQSWLKHGFLSTNSNACATCIQPPNGGAQLGVNCSDTYGAGLNGSQTYLGPRSQVNASTGEYPYPFTAPPVTGELSRRIQVAAADIAPASNPGALYFGECQYVTQDDAQWNNGLNNTSYRQLTFATPTSPNIVGNTIQRTPAIQAWQNADPTVTLVTMDYPEPNPLAGHGPITARFWLGAKVTNNGDGTYNYEYAVFNINSHRSGGSFSIPLPAGAHLSNIGFHGVPSHSGEPFVNTDWTSQVTPFGITWRTQTYTENANANALRWGTMYNFRFTADVAPASGNVSLGLFRPGAAGAPVAVTGTAPAPDLVSCVGDFNHDGGYDGADIGTFYDAFEGGFPAADVNRDGGVDGNDVEVFFSAWADGHC